MDKRENAKEHERLWGMSAIFTAVLAVVMVCFMGINNAKSYQILHLKYVQFTVCQSYLNKAIF